jgi:L-alanine-DL-glutamate epimerase-like enolase superfamily enzyme
MIITALETILVDTFPNLCYVRLHTDTGLIGLGETFFGPEAVAAHLHATAAPLLLGQDPFRVGRHWHHLYAGPARRSIGAEARALSAVDLALWDILGQAVGLPIYQLLGGAFRDRIRIYNTCAGYRHVAAAATSNRPAHGTWGIGGPTTGPFEDYEAQFDRPEELAASLLAQGISAVKLFPFDASPTNGHEIADADLQRGVDVFARMRQAAGKQLDLLLDFGSGWDLPTALRIARAIEEFAPFWFEDPLAVDNLDAWVAFRQSTPVPTAGSEHLGSRFAFRELLEKRAVDIVLFDPGWVGGISEGKKVAGLADAHHLPFCPHECTGPIAMIAGIHLCLSSPNALLQETVRAYWTGVYREIVTTLPRIEGGYAYPPEGSGLGTALRPDFIARSDARIRRSER